MRLYKITATLTRGKDSFCDVRICKRSDVGKLTRTMGRRNATGESWTVSVERVNGLEEDSFV